VAGLLRPRSAHLTTAVTGNTLQKTGFVPAWEKKNVLFFTILQKIPFVLLFHRKKKV